MTNTPFVMFSDIGILRWHIEMCIKFKDIPQGLFHPSHVHKQGCPQQGYREATSTDILVMIYDYIRRRTFCQVNQFCLPNKQPGRLA